jgi:hypothetical protein
MPDWSSNIWVVTIGGGFAVGIILAILASFSKGVRSAVVHLWTEIRRRTRTRRSAESFDLRFVEFYSFFGVATQQNGQRTAQIQSQWTVTNLSGMPAHLLRARLAKPRLPDARPQFEEAKGQIIIHDDEVIPANAPRRITINFFALLPPRRLRRSMTLKIVVVDQLNNEHALPVITVIPQVAPASTNPAGGQTP